MENKISVIIIDDEKDIVDTMSMYLELNNIDVKGMGYNGYDAYKLFKEKQPDFVILDMKMPDYDGNYAIEKIKKEDPNAKILVTSGFPKDIIKIEQVIRIFTKPLDMDEFVEEIQKLY